jgi:acyl-CoA synthetase (AMP-forming)/AMP-acid ligase II
MQNAAPRLPQRFNFAQHLLTLNEARGDKIAYRDDRCALSYADLAHRVRCFAAGLLAHGLQAEQRVLLVMLDTVDLPVAFLGALYAGVVPVPVNTLLTADNYGYMLTHSDAKMIVVSDALRATVDPAVSACGHDLKVVVSGEITVPFIATPTCTGLPSCMASRSSASMNTMSSSRLPNYSLLMASETHSLFRCRSAPLSC